MENKYYKPKIEEFHIGFEYEISREDDDLNEHWDKEVAEENVGVVLNELIKCGCIRVKYLDREDIESLGSDHDQTTKDGAYFYFGTLLDKRQYLLVCENARESKGGDYTHLSICDVNNKEANYFDGVVKNKSELIKLMTQLQIKS